MTSKIYVNLPVRDLAVSIPFYEALGFAKNPHFSDETAAGMTLSEAISVMLLTHEKFQSFAPRPIADARAATAVLNALQLESRAAVDATVARAAEAGGRADPKPAQEYGFMYGRSLEDPDGHVWELFWMDAAATPQQQEENTL